MFEISNQWLLFVLDLSVKSLVLVIVAGIAMKLFRVRDSNLKHRIWSGVLIGMLTLPLLGYLLPAIPVSLSQQWTSTEVDAQPEAPEAAPLAVTQPPTFAHEFATNADTTTISEPGSIVQASVAPTTTESVVATTANPVVASWTWADLTRLVTAALFLSWFSFTTYFGLRLLVGLWSTSRILKRAKNITDEINPHFNLHQGRHATVRQSHETCVPVTVGWLSPTILLPADWHTWNEKKLQAIIAHELTHVARRDFLVTIGADLNRCLYWFHPVSWWLRTRLSELAEHACDDAAIGQTGDRTGYARHLLEVASQINPESGRIVQPGLAMARESNVESRIATILDFKRPLSERLTWKSSAVIALIMVPLIGTAAAVRAVSPNETSLTQDTQEVREDADEKDAEDTVHIHGQVLDPDGKPVPDATLRIYAVHSPHYYASASTFDLVHTLTTDKEGRFEESVPREQLVRSDGKKHPKIAYSHLGPWTSMVVSAPGFADFFVQGQTITREINGRSVATPGFLDSEVPVNLRPAVPIEGRLLNLEGQPVPDLRVSVFKITHHDPDRIADWFAKVSKKPIKSDRDSAMMGGSQQGPSFPAQSYSEFPTDRDQSVKTDANGRFRMEGLIAKNDVAVLANPRERHCKSSHSCHGPRHDAGLCTTTDTVHQCRCLLRTKV